MNDRAMFKKPLHRWQPQEAPRNWLALGLLLAAWNAADHIDRGGAAVRKPDALRVYARVSVRAAQRLRGSLVRQIPSLVSQNAHGAADGARGLHAIQRELGGTG